MTRLQSKKTARLALLSLLLLGCIIYLLFSKHEQLSTPFPKNFNFGDAFNYDNDADVADIRRPLLQNNLDANGRQRGSSRYRPGSLSGSNRRPEFNAAEYLELKVEVDEKKNPSGFLGDITEVDPENDNTAADAAAAAELEYVKTEKQPAAGSRAGAPGPNGFKVQQQPAVVDEKAFAVVPDSFDTVKPFDFRIYSHNVKNGGHSRLVPGEAPWDKRSRKITASMRHNAIYNTIITLQEVYKFQLDDIMNNLNQFSPKGAPEWTYYGAGRIDGKEEGEFVPIIYKKAEWELVFSNTLWLNEKNSRIAYEGWDAKYLRIVSFVTLKHKQSGNYINVFNTHFDHIGEISQIGSANMIIEMMNSINSWPSILAGDLNCEPKSKAYMLLTENYRDLSKLVTPYNRYGHSGSTVTGFEGEVSARGGQTIDYIFVPKYAIKASQTPSCKQEELASSPASSKIYLQLLGFGLMHSKFNGLYMSDHRPLIADYRLGPKKC